MFNFKKKKICPIGIDLGSSSLKMIQLETTDSNCSLIAAARVDVPLEIQHNPNALHKWYISSIKRILAKGAFKGKKIVTCLPSRDMLIQHTQVARMDEKQLAKTLPFEVKDKLPFDINKALLRHIVVGEVYPDHSDETKLEVIVMAASGEAVGRHLNLLEHVKMEIGTINVESCAIVNSFKNLLQQDKADDNAVMIVDMGHSCTKVIIAHEAEIGFCRTISLSARTIIKAISQTLSINHQQALQMHQNYGAQTQHTAVSRPAAGAESLCSYGVPAEMSGSSAAQQISLGDDPDQIIDPILEQLGDEINSCVRYHDILFPSHQVGKIIFIGGQANNVALCQKVAFRIGLPAQIGDPLVRVDTNGKPNACRDLNLNELNSDWAIAFGLSMNQ